MDNQKIMIETLKNSVTAKQIIIDSFLTEIIEKNKEIENLKRAERVYIRTIEMLKNRKM